MIGNNQRVSLPNETKKELKHVPEQKKVSKEPMKSIVQQSKAMAEQIIRYKNKIERNEQCSEVQ